MNLDFARLEPADRIAVTSNTSRPLATVAEPERIQAVLQVLARHADGWEVPIDGVPVAGTRLNFYAGEEFLGNVGLAPRFLTAHLRGAFWSRRIDRADYDELIALIGLGLRREKPA